MRLGIRHQLLFPLLTLIAGMVLMVGYIVYSAAQRAHEQIGRNLGHIAETLQQTTPFLRNRHILGLMKNLSGADFVVVDAHGQPLRDSDSRVLTTFDNLPTELPEGLSEKGLGKIVSISDKSYFTRGIVLPTEGPGPRQVYLFLPEPVLQEAIWQAVRPGLIVGASGALVAVLLALTIHQRMTRRILELEQRTRIIAAGDFSPMPLPRQADELRDLAQSVNEMAQKLAQYQEVSKRSERLRLLGQVSGGLAHQLRNSAAGAKLALQLYARECEGGPPEAIDVALRQLALVEMHVRKFLDLGKVQEMRKAPADVGDVLSECVRLLQPQCAHAGISLWWEKPASSVILSVDASALSQAVLNVLTNAIEAAGPGGRVELSLTCPCHQQVAIEVWDSGPGPAADVAERLLEPFVTGKPEGVGMGLAVSREIVLRHHGTIHWQRSRGGTAFRLEIAEDVLSQENRHS